MRIDEEADRYGEEKNELKNAATDATVSSEHEINMDYVKLQTILKISRLAISKTSLHEDIKQIEKDLERTSYLKELTMATTPGEEDESSRLMAHSNALKNILITFAAFNQTINVEGKDYDLGYSQGYF
jgi:hypothetical protein